MIKVSSILTHRTLETKNFWRSIKFLSSGSRFVQLVRSTWILFYVLLITGIITYFFRNWANDDSFISFRYAYNLTQGLGFVYNPGERTLSTTTPLFTLLLALFSYIWSDIPRLAIFIGALGLALGGVFLWDLAHSWKTPVVGWVSLVLYPIFPILTATLGAETTLYIAFCLGTFAFYARQKYYLTAIFAAMATLTRPDGILVVSILVIYHLLTKRGKIPWKAVFIFTALMLPWLIFAWAYFGSPLPATLAAKQNQGTMEVSLRFAPTFLVKLKNYSVLWNYRIEAHLIALGIIYAILRSRDWLLFLCWPIVYFIAYTLLGVSGYYWYYAPLVPGVVVAISLGITALTDLLSIHKQKWFSNQITRLNQAIFLLVILYISIFGLGHVNELIKLQSSPDPRIKIYRKVGKWLYNHTPVNDKIGVLEVGIIGYYAHRPVIDFAGLIQPAIANQLKQDTTYEDSARWAIEHYHPDFVVLRSKDFPDLEQRYMSNNCQFVKQFDGQIYDFDDDINIYDCSKPEN